MPQVQVTISGRSYRMACGEGEERHLEGLAADYDAKITELRGSFGEIGDMRLHVMAALTLADELAETKRRLGGIDEEIAILRELASAGGEHSEVLEAQMAEALTRTAERIERLVKTLSVPAAAQA
jgi:cell division protein ZapA